METVREARRSRRAEARRRAILQAAARLFARKGFDRTTTREIALEADVAEGTIYNYFRSKQAIVGALVELVQDRFAVLAAALPSQLYGSAALTRSARSALDLICDEAVTIRGLVSVMWDQGGAFRGYLVPGLQGVIDVVEGQLRRGIAAGQLRPCDAAVAARMAAGMIIFAAIPYLRGLAPLPSAETRQEQAELVAMVFLQGLALAGGD